MIFEKISPETEEWLHSIDKNAIMDKFDYVDGGLNLWKLLYLKDQLIFKKILTDQNGDINVKLFTNFDVVMTISHVKHDFDVCLFCNGELFIHYTKVKLLTKSRSKAKSFLDDFTVTVNDMISEFDLLTTKEDIKIAENTIVNVFGGIKESKTKGAGSPFTFLFYDEGKSGKTRTENEYLRRQIIKQYEKNN